MTKRTQAQIDAEKRYKAAHPAITLRTSQECYDAIKQAAKERGKTHHGLINEILNQWVESN